MNTSNERGIALVLALFLMTALSVLGASLMFLSQTETYASMNYRVMSQTRYAAEAGVNKAANFLMDPAQYTAPTPVGGTDPITAYDTTQSPVQFNGQPVVLTAGAFTGVNANYPVAAVQAAFSAAGQGTLAAGISTLTYKTYAVLVSMQKFDSYGGGQSVIQTWDITSDGGMNGSSKATVRVEATVETPKVTANSYAAFATYNGCDAIQFKGNTTVDSYDSSQGTPAATTQAAGGDVGTNGNLHIWGSSTVEGNLYTPRSGVGACTAGAVTGLDSGGSAAVTGSMVQLPKAVTYPQPTFSAVPPTSTVTINAALLGSTIASATAACLSVGLTLGVNCDALTSGGGSAAAGAIGTYTTLVVNGGGADVTLPTVVVSSGYTLDIKGANTPGQTVNLNSITGTGNLQFDYASNNQMVILKIAGKNPDGSDMTTAFDLSQLNSWKQNKPSGADYDASALQIVYGGSQNIVMQGGNSQSGASIYAPNASFTLKGTQDLYGSILARTIVDEGNANIHYDRRLQRDFYVTGQPMLGTFSWLRAQ